MHKPIALNTFIMLVLCTRGNLDNHRGKQKNKKYV